MEKYTETAAVEVHTYSVQSYSDKTGTDCINSKQDCEIQLYIRNPKKFEMTPSFTFSDLPSSIDTSGVTIEQDSLFTLKMFLPQDFLLLTDEGKDISTKISLYEPMSGRTFEEYDLQLSCNTIPPQIQNATILNNNNKNFVIFFDMPDAEELATRHKDIACITINDKDYPVQIAADGSFSFEGERFSNTAKPTYSILDSKNVTDTSRSVYFESEDAFINGEKNYTLGLKDQKGLIQTVFISTEISRLSSPVVTDNDDVIYTNGANEMVPGSETDPFILSIVPPSTNHKGESVAGTTTLHYALYKGVSTISSLIKEGESDSTIDLELPEGTYYLETYATKTNYEQSPLTCVTLRVVDCAIFVSEDGHDETADGTREFPFGTLQAAIDDVDTRNMPDAMLTINVIGTLHEKVIVNPTIANSLLICCRASSGATIDADGDGPVFTIDTDIPVTIKNLTLTNGYAEKGAAILMKDNTKLTLAAGTKLTGNTAINNGGALYVPYGAQLKILNGVSITDNSAGNLGGGIYTDTNITISGAIEVSDNTVNGSASNIYLPSGIHLELEGSLTHNGNNSNIGISTEDVPTIPHPIQITEGYGYSNGNNSSVMPGNYFNGDHYAVTLDPAIGEAVVAVSGGSISDVLSTQIITFELEKDWFNALSSSNAARTIKINPTIIIDGVDETARALAAIDNPIIWNSELFINGILVPGCTFTTSEFVIPAAAKYDDIYTLHVQATYNGMSYDAEFTVYGYEH